MRPFFVLAVALAGCDGSMLTTDAGRDAEGGRDAGPSDAARVDAFANEDTGATDVGPPDAGEATIPVIVAAGSNHARWLSVDEGLTWCSVREEAPGTTDFDNPHLLRNITYANGRFVTGSWRAIFVSSNGYEWTDVTGDADPATGQWIAQIDFGNGWWVATGGYGTAMRSRDLETWEDTSDALAGNEASRTLVFGADVFVTGRDGVGWWQSTDGSDWTQRDASAGSDVTWDGTAFVPRPEHDRGRGIRLRSGWPDQIQRADDREGASFVTVATLEETPTHFAFGFAPAADYAPGRVPAALADCLGL